MKNSFGTTPTNPRAECDRTTADQSVVTDLLNLGLTIVTPLASPFFQNDQHTDNSK